MAPLEKEYHANWVITEKLSIYPNNFIKEAKLSFISSMHAKVRSYTAKPSGYIE